MKSMLRLCFVEALRRLAGQPTLMWIEQAWDFGYRSPFQA